MRRASLRVYDTKRRPIGKHEVTDEQVEAAIELYDREYPLNDYRGKSTSPNAKTWLENRTYRYAISYRGKCYPPKKILWLAIGPGSEERYRFIGGVSSANKVLEELGFEIVAKSERVVPE